MAQKRVLRRIAGLGWQVAAAGVRPMIVRGDGTVLDSGPLVGTAEAAVIVGVRPQNFVRDWASRADFPRPVAVLASGRVWRERDVRAYASARRRPKPDEEQLAAIARRVAWWAMHAERCRCGWPASRAIRGDTHPKSVAHHHC